MKLNMLLPLISISALLAAPAGAQQALSPTPAPTPLVYKFKAGDIDRYKMVMKFQMNIAIPGMPAMPNGGAMEANMSMVSVLRSKVLGILPNGNARVRYAYESVKMDMDMPGMPAAEKDKLDEAQAELAKQMPVITAVVNKYGQIVSMEGLDKLAGVPPGTDMSKFFSGQMGFGLGTGSLVFPAEPVTVGDAWTQDIPIMGAGKLTVDSTVESLNTKVGVKVGVKIKQDYYGHIDLADLMKAMLPALGAGATQMPAMNGGMDMRGWGVAYVDPVKGKLIRSDADVDMSMKMTATAPASAPAADGAPQAVNVNMNMNMKVNVINLPG
ncbi:MAG: hypothetical protein Q7T82_06105 [Armatimonadota bacterium]|nr:hypothetical protein [Armatimonadota bacterium]